MVINTKFDIGQKIYSVKNLKIIGIEIRKIEYESAIRYHGMCLNTGMGEYIDERDAYGTIGEAKAELIKRIMKYEL